MILRCILHARVPEIFKYKRVESAWNALQRGQARNVTVLVWHLARLAVGSSSDLALAFAAFATPDFSLRVHRPRT